MQAPDKNLAFNSVQPPRIRSSMFDLSHEKKLPFDFGNLIPSLCLEMVPGDTFEISNDIIIRFQPMLAPLLHRVDCTIHYFFVPTRLLWPKVDQSGNDWETFITGGTTGTNAAVAPRWNVSSGKHDIGSLWDYFGLPTWSTANNFATQYPDAVQPLQFPLLAYNLIWNEYYRDETLQAVINPLSASEDVLQRNWQKDFYTSALPWQQRGTAPGFPISGNTSAVWTSSAFNTANPGTPFNLNVDTVGSTNKIQNVGNATGLANVLGAFNNNVVSMSGVSTFNVSDLRTAIIIQRILERNAVGGVRYTEFLQSVYGCHPHDSRLQRPEYIGGVKQPVIFSEVLQTSSSNTQPTPLATMGGHGITVGRNYAGKYTAVEFGYIMGILSVMPETAYQQGIPFNWLRTSKYDWYRPEFAHMSERAVLNQELYLANDSANQTIFGYQGIFNEYRYQRNSVHGLFRTSLNFWHLGRIFSSRPVLNSAFIQLSSAEVTSLARVFAVTSQPGLLATVGNYVYARRPMPEMSDPGLYRV